MSEPVYCPECESPLPPSQWSAPGPVRCRRCGAEFVPPPRARDEAPRPRRRNRDDDWEPRRRNSNTPVVLLVLGVLFGVGLLTIAVGVGAYLLAVRPPAAPVAVAPPVAEDPAAPMVPAPRPAEPARGPEIVVPPAPRFDLPPDPGDAPKGAFPPRLGPPPVGPAPAPPDAPADFVVPVPAARVDITPAPLAAATTAITLPGPARDVCVGGDGRFVLFLVAGQRQIAVLDTSVGRVVKVLPAADDPVLMAAGMDKLVLVFPGKNLIQRWSLLTFERELTAPLQATGTIHRAAMGSASAGPVYLSMRQDFAGGGRRGQLQALDLNTFKPLTFNLRGGIAAGGHPQYPAELRVSADGTTLGMWNIGLSPSTLQVVSAEGNTLNAVSEHTSAGAVIPGPDGSTVFTGLGLYTRDAKPKGPERTAGLFLPAAHGAYHLQVENFGASKINIDGRAGKATVKLFAAGDSRPLLTLTDVEGLDMPADRFAGPATTVPLDRRILFVPRAEVLLSLAAAGDKVYLRRLNIDAAIEATGVDYLYIKSPAVADAERGTEFAHAVEVKARKGGVKLKLESGPDGMKLDGTTLRWRPPAAGGEPDVKVILSASDAAGQEVLQTLTVRVHDKGKLPKTVARAVVPAAVAAPAMVALKTPPPKQASAPSPPALPDGKATVRLPSAAGDDACFGGGGRYLILRLPAERKLAILDVTEARVVKYLPIAEADAKFAAGLTDLVVALPTAGVLQRWSLATFEKELTVQAPGQVSQMAMPSGADGPLAIQIGTPDRFGRELGGVKLYDPRTLKESDLKMVVKNGGIGMGGGNGDWQLGLPRRPRFSADGRLLIGCGTWVRGADGYESAPGNDFGTPSPDGRYIYGNARVWSPDGTAVGQVAGGNGRAVWYYAAVQGPYFFSLNQVPTENHSVSHAEFRLHVAGDTKEIYVHPDRAVFAPLFDWLRGQGVFGTHVFCVPDAELLVVLAKTNDAVTLQKLDLKGGLAKAGRDLLYVTDAPPPAERGSAFTYLPAVRSTRGGVKAKLETAPEGMKLTADGLVWDVPKDFVGSTADVLMTIADAGGQELFHPVRVSVYDAGKAPRPVALTPRPKAGPPAEVVTLKPAAGATLFPPAVLPDGKVAIKLPGVPKESCVGGGGRYLIFRLPDVKQLAVFDASAARVVKYLPLAEADAKFAATRTHLFIAHPGLGDLQRWALGTWEKELTVAVEAKIAGLAAGHDTAGPLFAVEPGYRRTGGQPILFDAQTLKPLPVRLEAPRNVRPGSGDRGVGMAASANGDLLVTPGGTYQVSGTSLTRTAAPPGMPSADGLFVCTAQTVFAADGQELVRPIQKHQGAVWHLPAADAPFLVSVNEMIAKTAKPLGGGKSTVHLNLRVGADPAPVMTVEDEAFVNPLTDWTRGATVWSQFLFVLPRARAIVLIDARGPTLEVRGLDIEGAIRKAEKPLIAVLDAPGPAARGRTFRYLPNVVATKGPVTAKLEGAPAGMKVTPDGLQWDVPKDFPDAEARALVLFKDAAGNEAFQTVRIGVFDAGKLPVPTPPPGGIGSDRIELKEGVELPPPAAPKPMTTPRPEPAGPVPRTVPDKPAPPAAFVTLKEVKATPPFPPATLPAGKTTVSLGGPTKFLCYAGGGRYLVFLKLPSEVVVFDASAAKVAYTVPVGEGVAAAGTRTHLFVSYTGSKTLERWDLATGKKELTAPAPTSFPMVVAGSDSTGPLFAVDIEGFTGNRRTAPTMIDPQTLKPIATTTVPVAEAPPPLPPRLTVGLALSADGSLLVTRGMTYRVSGTTLTELGGVNGHPTADGTLVCRGPDVVSPDNTTRPDLAVLATRDPLVWHLPTPDAPFVAVVSRKERSKGVNVPYPATVRLLVGAERVACTIAVDDLPLPPLGKRPTTEQTPRNVFALPRARVLAVATSKGDALDLRPLDVEAEVRKAETPMVVVVDRPAPVGRGTAFRYLPNLVATKGPVQARLEFAPDGMTLTTDGLKWDVPKDYPDTEAKALLLFKDAAGTETMHKVTVPIRAKE